MYYGCQFNFYQFIVIHYLKTINNSLDLLPISTFHNKKFSYHQSSSSLKSYLHVFERISKKLLTEDAFLHSKADLRNKTKSWGSQDTFSNTDFKMMPYYQCTKVFVWYAGNMSNGLYWHLAAWMLMQNIQLPIQLSACNSQQTKIIFISKSIH